VWVPRFRGWRRGSLYRGDEEGFLVHGEKGEGIGKLLEMVSSPVWLLFWYWGGDKGAAEVVMDFTFMQQKTKPGLAYIVMLKPKYVSISVYDRLGIPTYNTCALS
jgi:hypothetical protein